MIHFKSVSSRNFFSVGNQPIKILLDKSPTTLVSGKNGSGKSSVILDSICFGLFGNPFRNINKPAITNSINGKNCLVEIEFVVGNKNYLVKRGIKPNILEIYENGKLLTQDAASRDYQKHLEENILGGLNERVFKQVVILGSADYKPFMQLPAAQRREVIEELLDIRIFSRMLEMAKQNLITLKDTLKQLDYDVELQSEKIALYKDSQKKVREQTKEKKVALQDKITAEKAVIEEKNGKIATIQAEKKGLLEKIPEVHLIEQTLKDLNNLHSGLSHKHKSVLESISFFEANDTCYTCKQNISQDYKTNILTGEKHKSDELVAGLKKAKTEIEKKSKALEIIDKIQKNILKMDREIYQHQSDISSHQKYIKSLQNEIEELSVNKVAEQIKENMQEAEAKLLELKEKRLALIEERQYLELSSDLLKDGGIKTKIIKQYIPVMNTLINEYLERLGLPIEFTLDEQFNEVIKSRYRDKFQYNNFSEGEKQSVDLSILLTWRQIAKSKNTVNCNLLIMDETFDSSLDASKTEELLNILLEMDNKTNIFVISHKSDLADKMRSEIIFEKLNNFTRMV